MQNGFDVLRYSRITYMTEHGTKTKRFYDKNRRAVRGKIVAWTFTPYRKFWSAGTFAHVALFNGILGKSEGGAEDVL